MRRAYVDHKNRVCFFWSPKCASRSLTHWIYRAALGGRAGQKALEAKKKTWLRSLLNWGGGPRKTRMTDLVEEVCGSDFRSAANLVASEGYLSVAFVRHPARRIVSAYLNKFLTDEARNGRAYGDLAIFAKQAVDDVFENTGRRPNADGFSGISLLELLDYVERGADLSLDAPTINGHWNLQVHTDLLESGLTIDHVCAIETLEADFAPVREHYGSDKLIAGRNALAARKGAPADDDLSAVPHMDLAGRPFSSASFLSQPVLQRVAAIYRPDFEYLGYDPFDLSAPPAIKQRSSAAVG